MLKQDGKTQVCIGELETVTINLCLILRMDSRMLMVGIQKFTAIDREDRARRNEMEQNEPVLQPKPVSESKSEMIELVLPNDANPLGALLGGRLMHWIDLAGALAAHRHSHSYVVTASMDHIDFLVPVHVGDMVVFQSSVNRVFKTSMEVGVKVSVENYISSSRQKVARAYLTFVAVDRHGRRLPVNPVIPESEDEKRRYDGALRRREATKAEREQRKAGKP
jgi:acyl-CoA hydrolase